MRGEGGGGGAEPLKLEGLVAAMLWQRRSKHDPPTPNPPPPSGGSGGLRAHGCLGRPLVVLAAQLHRGTLGAMPNQIGRMRATGKGFTSAVRLPGWLHSMAAGDVIDDTSTCR